MPPLHSDDHSTTGRLYCCYCCLRNDACRSGGHDDADADGGSDSGSPAACKVPMWAWHRICCCCQPYIPLDSAAAAADLTLLLVMVLPTRMSVEVLRGEEEEVEEKTGLAICSRHSWFWGCCCYSRAGRSEDNTGCGCGGIDDGKPKREEAEAKKIGAFCFCLAQAIHLAQSICLYSYII